LNKNIKPKLFQENFAEFQNNKQPIINRKFEILSKTMIFHYSHFKLKFMELEGVNLLILILNNIENIHDDLKWNSM